MDIRELQPGYAVSPQIDPADIPALAEAGFRTVICNRPDGEVGDDRDSAAIRRAVQAAGLTFVFNPVTPGLISEDNVQVQRDGIAASDGPVFAYCASGNRSSIVWALAQAGHQPTDALIAAAAAHGYQLEPFRARIDRQAG